MDTIDLRSDTVTWPTPEMRKAMATAELGDDVYGEDPTVNRLEAMGAAYMGMEAAVFVPSGTMGNLAAILAHCQRGDEMLIGQTAHSFVSEVGGASALGGIHPHTLPVQQDGTFALDDIRAALRDPMNIHHPRSRLIILENTNGRRGGIPLTPEYTQSVRELADEHGLLLHIDGARVWNAVAALECKPADLAGPAHSISFCLSKGLCAPAGSLLCGTREFVARARRIRKMLGGGMRQVGVLAAAGLVALEEMTGRLAEDHITARQLAEGLSKTPGVNIDMSQVQTNMVLIWLSDFIKVDSNTISAELDMRYNVRIGALTPRSFRAVTHYWITPEGVDRTVEAFAEVLENVSA
jgi:threonine aldolase